MVVDATTASADDTPSDALMRVIALTSAFDAITRLSRAMEFFSMTIREWHKEHPRGSRLYHEKAGTMKKRC